MSWPVTWPWMIDGMLGTTPHLALLVFNGIEYLSSSVSPTSPGARHNPLPAMIIASCDGTRGQNWWCVCQTFPSSQRHLLFYLVVVERLRPTDGTDLTRSSVVGSYHSPCVSVRPVFFPFAIPTRTSVDVLGVSLPLSS